MVISGIGTNNLDNSIEEPNEERTRPTTTPVTVNKLDGSSKDAAYFDIEFEAESVRFANKVSEANLGADVMKASLGNKVWQDDWLAPV